MGKPSIIPNKILDPALQAISQSKHLSKWPKVQQEMALTELIQLKLQTIATLKNLANTLLQSNSMSFTKIKNLIEKIEAHQYNLVIFKQLNAIANVGSPDTNMFGINACIFQSGDLKTLNIILNKVISNNIENNSKEAITFREDLDTKIQNNETLQKNLYSMQAEYNKNIRVKVEYLVIK